MPGNFGWITFGWIRPDTFLSEGKEIRGNGFLRFAAPIGKAQFYFNAAMAMAHHQVWYETCLA